MAAFENSRLYRPSRPRLRGRSAAGLASALLAIAAGMILVSHIEPSAVAPIRGWIAGWIVPVGSAAASALEPVSRAWGFVRDAAARQQAPAPLTPDVARAAALEMRLLDVERENRELKSLAHFARNTKPSMVSARAMMSSATPLSQTVIVDAGRQQGVKGGMVVVSGNGLVGRVVHAHAKHATILLLSDRLSRVPVVIGLKQARAVLVGTGTAAPKLEFIGAGTPLTAGDFVTTSGTGGVFPRGLSVGVVVADGAEWHVALTSGRDDPLVVGILMMEGATFDPYERGGLATAPPATSSAASPTTTRPSSKTPTALLEAK